jgi:hypothetical protein
MRTFTSHARCRCDSIVKGRRPAFSVVPNRAGSCPRRQVNPNGEAHRPLCDRAPRRPGRGIGFHCCGVDGRRASRCSRPDSAMGWHIETAKTKRQVTKRSTAYLRTLLLKRSMSRNTRMYNACACASPARDAFRCLSAERSGCGAFLAASATALFSIMTTEATGIVEPVHEKAMPAADDARRCGAMAAGPLRRGRAENAEAGAGRCDRDAA